jgi:hypothetical protein
MSPCDKLEECLFCTNDRMDKPGIYTSFRHVNSIEKILIAIAKLENSVKIIFLAMI